MNLITFFNSITVTTYGFVALFTWVILQAIKQTKIDNRWLPLLAIIIGALIGAIAALFIYGTDAWLGAGFGLLSGFASTGVNEAFNQYAFSPDEMMGDNK
ncbi:holin [Leuconostoc citreum]|uniref:holin n=1 Tax=Leuconostoc citreum TaxID=33964 RepID=UPI0021A804EF|nr:holin [Leuconostoc citreum]MCT3075355.1 holin [Leuconostoc citreum]